MLSKSRARPDADDDDGGMPASVKNSTKWHGYSLLQNGLGTYLAMNFEAPEAPLPVRAMELDPDGVPVKGMLWKLNADGSLQNRATAMMLQIKDKSEERCVPVQCAERYDGIGEGSQRWALTDKNEIVNKGNGFLLTVRNGSKATRTEVWCNFRWPLRGTTNAQKWYFRPYDGEPKDPLYPVNPQFRYLLKRKVSIAQPPMGSSI